MTDRPSLIPAAELAARNKTRMPNESAEYRQARTALLAEEIELRRHIERVAAQRRALPPGGEVKNTYRFQGERGPVTFADLFGEKQSLFFYSWMYGPQRERLVAAAVVQQRRIVEGDGRDPDVGNAQVGTPVLIRGVASGRIERIELEEGREVALDEQRIRRRVSRRGS